MRTQTHLPRRRRRPLRRHSLLRGRPGPASTRGAVRGRRGVPRPLLVTLFSVLLAAAPPLSGVAVAYAPPSVGAAPLRLHLLPDESQLQFQARDALGGFEGRFDSLAGQLRFDAGDPASAAGAVSADPASIDTGNGARDANARRVVLEPDRYPTLRFRLGTLRLADGALEGGGSSVLTVEGELTLHGVSRPLTVSGTARRDGERLQVDASFEVRLSDFDMARPRFLFVVVEDAIAVTVHLVFGPDAPGG